MIPSVHHCVRFQQNGLCMFDIFFLPMSRDEQQQVGGQRDLESKHIAVLLSSTLVHMCCIGRLSYVWSTLKERAVNIWPLWGKKANLCQPLTAPSFFSLLFICLYSISRSSVLSSYTRNLTVTKRKRKLPFKKASGCWLACIMAAIDLERGLEHSGRGWGQERTELIDNFDSEMQEWEDQLQDIQRKIEEV